MKKLPQQLSSDELRLLFARLNPLEVEQFYTAYSLWSTQQRIQELQTQIDSLHQDITANMEQQDQVHPSALTLATLARLQSKGVSDITILDRMLDRGEVWLDHTIQHLEYCERLNVLRNDYTTWCEHALEGAYDWIDSIQGTENPSLLPSTLPTLQEFTEPKEEESIEQNDTDENSEPASEIIEALFLQKLMSDDTENAASEFTEDTASMLDITLKIPVIPKSADGASLPLANTVQPAPSEHYTPATEQETGPEDVETTPVLIETQIWQSETYPEAVEATPVLEETPIEQDIVTMVVIEQSQEHIPTIQDQHNGNPIESTTNQTPSVESSPVSSFGTSYDVDQVETPNRATAVKFEQGSNVQVEHFYAPPKRNKGFWRTMLAFLFHV